MTHAKFTRRGFSSFGSLGYAPAATVVGDPVEVRRRPPRCSLGRSHVGPGSDRLRVFDGVELGVPVPA